MNTWGNCSIREMMLQVYIIVGRVESTWSRVSQAHTTHMVIDFGSFHWPSASLY